MAKEKAWKAAERKTARILGGERILAAGNRVSDVEAGRLLVEVKYRQELPVWLTSALSKVRGQTSDDQLGMVVLWEKGSRDGLVVMSLNDYRAWYGDDKEVENGS